MITTLKIVVVINIVVLVIRLIDFVYPHFHV
jgi:hypothetical protein